MKTTQITPRWLKASRLVVKRTAGLNRYGARCAAHEPMNNRVWPGEAGEIRGQTLRGVDWEQDVMVAEFPHGRWVRFACRNMDTGEWEFELGFDPEDFRVEK